MRASLRQDRGVAGLNILLSMVVILFVIGFLVMIFSIMGGEMEEAGFKETSATLTNITTLTVVNETGSQISGTQGYYNCVLTLASAINQTSKSAVNTTDFTEDNTRLSGCWVQFSGDAPTWYNNSLWNVSGTYTYDANTTASQSIFDSTDEISSVTDWFGIIIVLGAMVVLILLTVIIISAIRGSGLVMAEGERGGSAGSETA